MCRTALLLVSALEHKMLRIEICTMPQASNIYFINEYWRNSSIGVALRKKEHRNNIDAS